MDPRPVLTRFDAVFYMPRSAPVADRALIPVYIPGATPSIVIHRQGATVAANTTIFSGGVGSPSQDVPVYDVGGAAAGGTVARLVAGAGWGVVLPVTAVKQGILSVRNDLAVGFVLEKGTRMFVLTPGAYFYQDAMGGDAQPQNSLPLETFNGSPSGRARGYVREGRFDYVVTGTRKWFFTDIEGGFVMRG